MTTRMVGLLIPVLSCLLFTFSDADLRAEEARLIQLDNGESLRFESTQHTRILPYSFYDQAMASLPGLYPEVEILAKRRLGYLGSNPPHLYALVGYSEDPSSDEVVLRGIVTRRDQAWEFNLITTTAKFDQTLLLVLEYLSSSDF